MQRIAKRRGGKCLSENYINCKTKLLWECKEGHQWEATPDNIKRKTWCPKCGYKNKGERRKLNIGEMEKIANKRKGKCLSDVYFNAKTKLLWECKEGHQWEATPGNIKQGQWCPKCGMKRGAESRKSNIKEMQKIAKKRNGKCLSEKYINNNTKLLWQCKEGHQWEAKPGHIKKDSWCPYCSGTVKLTIEEMRDIAKERGGRCLSNIYINSKTKLLWECKEGHQWEATPSKIKHGQWCPYCAGMVKLTIKEMKSVAKKREGRCLSAVYINARSNLLWECKKGHQWEATPGSINSGTWCPQCGKMNTAKALTLKNGIEKMQKIAKERGGICLSKKYIKWDSKLDWECKEGHQWKAVPNSIQNGSWCPVCSSGLGERICREFFEQLFEKKFPKRFPEWLINQKGNQMELDGYNKSLRLAFEHHGLQHYSAIKFFSKSENWLKKRQADDKLKRELCELQGIVLIEVPEIPTLLLVENVKAFIREDCERHSIPLPVDFDSKKVDLQNAYFTYSAKSTLETLKLIAKERGGRCLSNTYINAKTKLLWECTEGHQWETAPTNIKSGRWCPICGGKVKLTIEEMQKIANKRKGKCLSEKYINNNTKLLWQCKEGHQWETTPSNIKMGRWCPKCRYRIKRS